MKRILTFTLLSILGLSAGAQSFYTYPKTSSLNGSHEAFEIVLHGFIVNQSADSLFTWIRIENDLETGWEASICDKINCWSPTLDSNSFILVPGDSSIMDPHFYPNNYEGCGNIKIMVWAGNDKANADTMEFNACTWALGMAALGKDKPVQVYPNPTQGQLHLEFETEGSVDVEIFDLLGKKMRSFSHEGNHSSMDLSDLPNGLYIIRINEDGEVYSRTFRKAN